MNMQSKEQFSFTKAERKKAKLKLNLNGASGSGKTYSALVLASSLGKKIAVIDTENESASLYANEFNFDTLPLKPPYSPERFAGAIHAAYNMGYEVLIIDSASHEWIG
ncbi:AAA family ATPase, partial [Acinetobacter baumannii]